MRKLILAFCCITVLSGCTAPRGRIVKVGTITISGYEFSDCTNAAAISDRVLLCGYTVEELMLTNGAEFDSLTFSGDDAPVVLDGEWVELQPGSAR